MCCTKVVPNSVVISGPLDDGEYSGDEIDEEDEEFADQKLFQNVEDGDLQLHPMKKSNADNKEKMTKFELYYKRYRHFVDSPRVHFVYETFFYIIFLSLFSYMMLCDFNYEENGEESTLTNPINFTNESISKNNNEGLNWKSVKNPNITEYIITFWIISFVIEEFRQVN